MINRRQIISMAALAPLASQVSAQDNWPQRPIRIVNPGAPGGTNDTLTRYLAEPLSKILGQPIVIDSKAGAGGAIGTQFVAREPADGYTFLTHHNGFITSPLVRNSSGYEVKDLVPASLQGTSPMILMAHPSMPATLAEFVAYARSNPGKLEWGTASLGGVGHLATEVFHDMAGIKDMVRVAFSGSAPAVQALLGGQVKYLLSTPSASTAGLVKEGRLRFLGVSYPNRVPTLPDVPAIAEVVPGFSASVWFGLLARAGTPQAILDKFSQAVSTVLAQPDVVDKYMAVNVVAKGGQGDLAEILKREQALWSKVVKDKNIRLD
ncbi:tripartite tricarboxylate transporter substrate-binding protein [Hydrogenophaga sp.]|uniref:Bug family tripartite tricarboxylate transporter substrate binding protein n=1 Tax=Hydrogenophaga sp. TaxID=1904254 RepID=UPI002623A839|nr:tripartite tricarboxylate transporter substrate-binding protein [Hydrogenophaga sp.]MCW5652300.1 tripartite tricarboxylate transporter substrate binding protein [Hydrogenophaga sp.]